MSIISINGQFYAEDEAKISVLDAGFLYGEGIYETLKTVDGKVANVELHLDRLEHSASVVGLPLPPRDMLSDWLQQVVDENGYWRDEQVDSRVRLTVSGGRHGFDEQANNVTVVIVVDPLVKEDFSVVRQGGVSVVSFQIERPLVDIKTTHLIPSMLARRHMRKKGAYEVLLVNRDGFVTEGSITNVFAWMDGRWVTPASDVLGGTTRRRILAFAGQSGDVEVVEKDFTTEKLMKAEEIFICNAPRGIIPVIMVDGISIGSGNSGKHTKFLQSKLS